MIMGFFRLNIVTNQVSTTDDFTNKEEGIDFGENDTTLCNVREGQVLELVKL